ncbi:MAG TPA: PilN domain-containing protein [Vicinamibacterales bacterium]|nr:PilN domain-containing protein [Vicinamibacterales bacterium]
MIRINLLGTERARVSSRAGITDAQKITAAGLLILLLTAGYIGWTYWSMRQEDARLDQEIAAGELEAERLRGVLSEVERFENYRAALAQRVALIEQLRRSQTGPVHLLDEISRALPDRLWLVELTQKGDEVSIDGRTSTLSALTDFVANLQNSQYFRRPVEIVSSVTEIDPQGELEKFVVRAIFVPGGNALAPAVAAPAPPAGQGRN